VCKFFTYQDSLEYLQRFIRNNKGRGMIAEIALDNYLQSLDDTKTCKILEGGWLLSPKDDNFYSSRYIVFVLPYLFDDYQSIEHFLQSKEKDRGFQSIFTFFSNNGIGVIISGATCLENSLGNPDPNKLQWANFIYSNLTETLTHCEGDYPFIAWPSNRGRPSSGEVWSEDVSNRFQLANQEQLTALVLRQAFFYGYLKGFLRKPVSDPYDVDRFLVGYRGTILPIEIKEKSPTDRGDFGIDAGRIFMLLRLCLSTDSNALYIVRSVDRDSDRSFQSWQYITLSDILMGCSWNLQAGGRGMTGGNTQAVMLSGNLFKSFDLHQLTERWLTENSSLQVSVKHVAEEWSRDLSRFLKSHAQ
jgi:hypothetical protein